MFIAGAMRLPGTGETAVDGDAATDEPSHFMTDFYAQKLGATVIPFVNTGTNGFYRFYGEEPIRMSGEFDTQRYDCKFVISSQ